jgi:hypothetical protein
VSGGVFVCIAAHFSNKNTKVSVYNAINLPNKLLKAKNHQFLGVFP